MIRHEPHSPAVRNCREQKHALRPGETLTDTDSRSTPKWKIRELGPRLFGLFGPSLRIEYRRFCKVSLVPMHDPLTHQNQRTSRNTEIADRIFINVSTANDPGGREQAH